MNTRLQQLIDKHRAKLAQAIAPPALRERIMVPRERLHICGLIRAREVPFDSEEEWRKWWLCERNLSGQIIGPARMSEKEKERYTVAESRNILVSAGISLVLTFIGSNNGNTTGFAQYFAVGNVGINQVLSNDTSLAGEYFRAAPSTANQTGVQIDVSTFAGTSQANGSITNCGLFGGGASGTLGSGTMYTHSLFQYTKTNSNAVTFDYLLSYV